MKHTTMKHPMIAGLAVLVTSLTVQGAEPKTGLDTQASEKTYPTGLWRSEPPPDCPFKASESFSGVEFSGRNANYTWADTWFPSWAADGNMYSPWTDGYVYGVKSASHPGEELTTGQAKITGGDPMKLEISEYAVYKSDASPYAGRYPCGTLVHNGVWYYGTYCLHPFGENGQVKRDGTSYCWPWLGPFVGFRWSTDYGKTWTQTPCTPEKPLFGESALKAGYSGNLVGKNRKRRLLERKSMDSAAWFERLRGGLGCSPELRKGAACRAFDLAGAGVWCMDEAPGFLGVAAEQPQIYPL